MRPVQQMEAKRRARRVRKVKVEEPTGAQKLVARRLEAELSRVVDGDVRFDPGSRALYATDASNYRQVPIGVVMPRSTDDVLAALSVCREFGAPVLARGGGTSLAGQCCNVAVVFDFTRYLNRVIALDPERGLARVQPGCVLDELNRAALAHGVRFGPDPSTHTHCTLGGMIGNNSCGVHSVMTGRTSQNVFGLEVATYRGQRLAVARGPTGDGELNGKLEQLRDRYASLIRERFPHTPRRSSGFALDALLPENGFNVAAALTGTEGTCAVILEATVRLVPWPKARSLLVLGYPDVFAAADDVPAILPYGPIGLEGLDDVLVGDMKKKNIHPRDLKLLPDGDGWLLVEFGGADEQEADARASALMAALRKRPHPPTMRLLDNPEEELHVWRTRESGLGATAFLPGEDDAWEGWEDSAVPPEHLGDYLREFRALLGRHGYRSSLYGHFGDGCLHCRINFELVTEAGIAKYRAFVEDAADLVVKYRGSFSGEHGDGQSRGELLEKMYGPELVRAFREFKQLWDPDWKLNPGKVVEPYKLDENLRLGTAYHPAEPATHFAFPEDRGSFARAALRCVGVGECRKHEGGTMCPSYRATREEQHSTRGRAHLLFEMLRGEVLEDGFRDERVHEALDLCLACKACRSECPVNVDMATYKAEFLAHYYEGRMRPLSAYAMGLIDLWAGLASHAPSLANWLAHSKLTAPAMKAMAGLARERELPRFARRTFQSWFEEHGRGTGAGPEVLLWPDTFTNHFDPDIGRAAVDVLNDAGAKVVVPKERLCCGRPLYDFGMLDRARSLLLRTLEVLRPAIRSGVPIVVLEPSCAAVFKDELRNLLPNDADAQRLAAQTFLLADYLKTQRPQYRPPPLRGDALVHGHCHHKSVFGMASQREELEQLGLNVELLDSGCCGMAGSFGYEQRHYDVSIKVGEQVLLPRVRGAPRDTLLVADGFSCRSQIAQTTSRRAVHSAQALQLAIRRERAAVEELPEKAPELHVVAASRRRPSPLSVAGTAAVLLGAGLLWRRSRRRG